MRTIGKAEAEQRLNRVRPIAIRLVDNVPSIVHHIGVIASATKHMVRTGTTIQPVIAA